MTRTLIAWFKVTLAQPGLPRIEATPGVEPGPNGLQPIVQPLAVAMLRAGSPAQLGGEDSNLCRGIQSPAPRPAGPPNDARNSGQFS